MKLVKNIHPKAISLLQGKPVSPMVMNFLLEVRPGRQVAMARLMVNLNNYTKVFARALLLGTPARQMSKGATEKQNTRVPIEQIAQMESELGSLERDFKEIQPRYCQNMLELTVMQRYVRGLLQNLPIRRFVESRYPDLYLQLRVFDATPPEAPRKPEQKLNQRVSNRTASDLRAR